jgi:hypothetical protein
LDWLNQTTPQIGALASATSGITGTLYLSLTTQGLGDPRWTEWDDVKVYQTLLANGTFNADTGWTKGTGWTIAGGVASCDGTQGADTDLEQPLVLEAGKAYHFQYTLSNVTAGNVRFDMQGSGQSEDVNRNADGTYSGGFIATGAGTFARMFADTNFIGDVDNVILSEALPDYSGNDNPAQVFGQVTRAPMNPCINAACTTEGSHIRVFGTPGDKLAGWYAPTADDIWRYYADMSLAPEVSKDGDDYILESGCYGMLTLEGA